MHLPGCAVPKRNHRLLPPFLLGTSCLFQGGQQKTSWEYDRDVCMYFPWQFLGMYVSSSILRDFFGATIPTSANPNAIGELRMIGKSFKHVHILYKEPLPVISGAITPISRAFAPHLPIFFRPFIGPPITLLIAGVIILPTQTMHY